MFPSPGIGDIIAICTLIIKVGTVLCESREVPQEYEELSRELNALYELLQTVKNLYDPSLTAQAAIALLRVERQAKSCEDAMNVFLKDNEPPKSKTRKAVWAIRAPVRAASLRQKLSTHRQMLGIFLCEFRAQQQNDTLALCRKEITVLKPVIQGITLLDAVGNRMEIPFLFCRTYELLSDTLGILFKHQELPGLSFVTRGDYQLVHGTTRNIVAPTQWTFTLSPEMVVEMSMILRRRNQSDNKCPRCGTDFTGESVSGWASCSICPGQFQIKQEVEEGKPEIEIISPAANPLGVAPGIASKLVAKDTVDEWQKFRLLSIISSLRRESTHLQQAYDVLGVPINASDEMISIIFKYRVENNPTLTHKMREAVEFIAESRTSAMLRHTLKAYSTLPPSDSSVSRADTMPGFSSMPTMTHLPHMTPFAQSGSPWMRDQSIAARKIAAVGDGEFVEGQVVDEDLKPYCICGEPSFGQMIGCDDAECEFEWFHIGCLGMPEVLQGEFCCTYCQVRRQKQQKEPGKSNGRGQVPEYSLAPRALKRKLTLLQLIDELSALRDNEN